MACKVCGTDYVGVEERTNNLRCSFCGAVNEIRERKIKPNLDYYDNRRDQDGESLGKYGIWDD